MFSSARLLFRMGVCLLIGWSALLLPVHLVGGDKAIEVLEENGLKAEPESLRDYLKSLHPDSDSTRHFKELINQLGDDDFFKREAALRELIRHPIHAPGLLNEAVEGNDPEVAWRAKQVLKLANGRTDRLLNAVFTVIEDEKIGGLTDAIVKAFPFCDKEYLQERAGKALTATATKNDSELLQKLVLAGDSKPAPEEPLRVAAISALEKVAGTKADETFIELMEYSEPEPIRFAASQALANHGNHAALPTLVSLLESEDVIMRVKSLRVLRATTGRSFNYLPLEENATTRALKVLAWKRWLEEDSEDVELKFPIQDIVTTFGRTLFANYSQRRVYELDSKGNVVWQQQLNGVWAVEGLMNGHRLIASYTSKFLVEYDAAGKEVWRFDDLPNKPYSVQRLPNGNTLVPIYGQEILEIRPDKTFARRIKVPETVKWAEQLENGRILVVFYTSGRIAEIDTQGQILWSVGGMGQPYSVQRLDNGNTLVANRRNNQVLEVDRSGQTVWSYAAKPSLYRAQRLADGNTLIVSSTGAIEVNPRGEIVWQRSESGLRGIDRY